METPYTIDVLVICAVYTNKTNVYIISYSRYHILFIYIYKQIVYICIIMYMYMYIAI